jgi:two-component system CheB/CheR fusion protein
MLRVLVVEDDHDTRATECALLRAWGHHAEEAALSVAASVRPDVVLLDIGMPDMDGYEVARRLRDLPGLEKTLLVAMTGFGQPDEVQACLQAGCDLHLLKPCDPPALKQLLALHAEQTTT